jgi:GNAT superfamily N-acetyltransferase
MWATILCDAVRAHCTQGLARAPGAAVYDRGVISWVPSSRARLVPMTTRIALRHAGLADLASVAALADETWRQHYPGILSDAQIDYMLARGYARDALAPFVLEPQSGIALAERGGELLGFAAWQPTDARDALKLDKLYVQPRHHGEGIGSALLNHIADVARAAGCMRLVLNVNRRNDASIRWYERRGFVVRERGDFPIGNGFVMEDFIMEKPLG